MAKLLSTIIDGFLASKNFISGALGSGWKIWKMNGRYKFEVDDVVVRNTMTVFELLISKIRAVKGALGITQASGKIKSVREDADNYYVQIEDEMTFVAHDIIKCQTFSSGQKNYWVIVDSIRVETVGSETISEIVISKSEFSGSSLPEVSDEIVQFGNTTDVRRQSAIYLHADENGVPAIDVLFNINAKTFDGCTKVRIGGDLPNEDGYKGFFCENGLIKSVNESGETIYMLRPDGSGFVAKEAIKWAVDGSGSIGDGAISWRYDKTTQKYVVEMGNNVILTWNNLDEQTKENLKGEGLIVEFSADGEEWHTIFESGDLYQRQKVGNGAWNGPFKIVGQDANLLPWIEEWNSPDNQTEIGGEYVISPKMFSGTKGSNGKLTGVAFGRGVVIIVEDGVEKKKTGIFGLKDGNITFSIDENGDASFTGYVKAKSGEIGSFIISEENDGRWLTNPANTMGLSGRQLHFTDDAREVYVGSVPGEGTAGSTKLISLKLKKKGEALTPAYALDINTRRPGLFNSSRYNYAIYAVGSVYIDPCYFGEGFVVKDVSTTISSDTTYYGDDATDTFIFSSKKTLTLGWSESLPSSSPGPTKVGKIVYVSGGGVGGFIRFHDNKGTFLKEMELVGYEGAIFRATMYGWYMVAGKP